ncbi:MAG: glycogen/starch synthase [Prevotella sp.]
MAKKILFINQEISPYVAESEMSVMGRDLPHVMQENGYEIRTFMPKWGNINERRGQLHEVIRLSGMNLIIDDTDHPLIIKVASIPQTRLQVYFIDNDDYFMKRLMATDGNGVEYTDNGERAIFFARGVLETVKKLRWIPDIIHCQGWMGAVVPLYVKKAYHNEPTFANTKIVTSFFSSQLQDDLAENFKQCLEFRDITSETLSVYEDKFNYLELAKLAIDYSDAVVEAANDVDQRIIQYASGKNLPLLKLSDGISQAAYNELYNRILGIDSAE